MRMWRNNISCFVLQNRSMWLTRISSLPISTAPTIGQRG